MRKTTFYLYLALLVGPSLMYAQGIALKANVSDAFAGRFGGGAEFKVHPRISIFSEFQKLFIHRQKTTNCFWGGNKTVEKDIKGYRIFMSGRFFVKEVFNGFFMEVGAYTGRYSTWVKETDACKGFFSPTQATTIQINGQSVPAVGLRYGIGWQWNRATNLEISLGFSKNYNDADPKIGLLASKEGGYVRCMIGGVITSK